jgi:hypothetical protein
LSYFLVHLLNLQTHYYTSSLCYFGLSFFALSWFKHSTWSYKGGLLFYFDGLSISFYVIDLLVLSTIFIVAEHQFSLNDITITPLLHGYVRCCMALSSANILSLGLVIYTSLLPLRYLSCSCFLGY